MSEKSNSKTILFISYSRNSLGYIIPSSIIAKKLQQDGYRVIFACSDKEFTIPKSMGINELINIYEKPPMQPWHTFNINDSYKEITKKGLANPEYLEKCLEDETNLIQKYSPDLVMFNFRFTVGIAANRLRIPAISILNLNILTYFPDLLLIIIESLTEIGINDQEMDTILGDSILVPDYSYFQPLKNIPEKLFKIILKGRQEIKYIGPCIRQNPDSLLPQDQLKTEIFQQSKKPLIYITLGGSVNTEQTIVELMKYLDVNSNYIFVTGPNVDPLKFDIYKNRLNEKFPDSNIRIEQFTNNSIKYMKAADLAIIHGGHSTTIEAMLCSTPVIGIPNNDEQKANIKKLVRIKTGICLPFNEIKDKLNDLIKEMLNNLELKAKANNLSKTLKTNLDEELINYITSFLVVQKEANDNSYMEI